MILVVFVSSFSFFSSSALAVGNQSSDCAKDKRCLEEKSEFSEAKSLIKSEESSQSAGFSAEMWKDWHSSFEVISPPPSVIESLKVFPIEEKAISDKAVQAVQKEVSSQIKTAQADEGQRETLAQAGRNRCRNAPWIEKAVVFQSVEAPQIEPLQEQYEDHQGLPYGEYDLVRRKPATVFVDIRGLRRRSGRLKAFVNDKLYFEEDIRGNQTDFPIDLPMRADELLDGVGSATVWIYLIPDRDPVCYDKNSFKVTVWETKTLDLRFAKINNRNCKPLNEYPLYKIGKPRTYEEAYNVSRAQDLPYWPYGSVSRRAVENFKFSDEVKGYLPEMLPLARGAFRAYRDIIDLEGHCDNAPVRLYGPSKYSESIGILEDINELERQRIKKGGVENKMVAIIPMDYLPFHRANSFDKKEVEEAVSTYGFVLHRQKYSAKTKFLGVFEWTSSKSGGSSDVIFVREDRYKHSTLSHELGHSLGQRGREFYDEKQKCRDFKYQTEKECPDYEMKRSLKFGKIELDLLSIMHEGDIPINQKWIDRETFQKIFVYLLKEDNRRLAPTILNSPLSKDKAVSRDRAVKKDPIVIISGIYLKSSKPEEEKFLYEPKIEIHKEGGQLTPFVEEGDIQVELKLGGEVIYTNHLSSFAEIEFLREGGGNHKTHKLSSVPITVSLPLKYGKTDYEVVIKQMINGSKERALFSRKLQRAE
ncbi:MAG: hypothetical protein OXJ52_04230 [Oligoflexia bacterium]|nr:hypothetical protein [Oligoflexia bacterium]